MKETLRQYFASNYSDGELKQWFDPLSIEGSEDNKRITVVFPHPFFAQWFETTAQERFEEGLHGALGPGFVLRYHASGNGTSHSHGHIKIPDPDPPRKIDFPFGHEFTFKSYIANRKNHFVVASAREVATRDAIAYNPLVITGGEGSGKTHLLRAVANELAKRRDLESIFIGQAEDLHVLFTKEANGDPLAFRKLFSDRAYLLVDDFHTVSEYPELADPLVRLFNDFYESGRQMVFSAAPYLGGNGESMNGDDPKGVSPKLASRLKLGLWVELKEHDLDIRTRFIQGHCRDKKLPLTKEQILTLAQRFTDFRSLQGVLLKFQAFRELVREEVRQADFERILKSTEHEAMRVLDPKEIIEVVADHFAVSMAEITGGKRKQAIVQARQVAMYLCRQLTNSSYPALGRLFGGKDHSTAMYGVKKIKTLQQDNQDMKLLVTRLTKQCLERRNQIG